MNKTFEAIETVDDLNRVNDEQKAIFAALVAADPDLIETRQQAYLRRWSEALPYLSPGEAVLDIGAGWPVDRVAQAIFAKGVAYHVVDIDEDQIAAWSDVMRAAGQDGDQAKHCPSTVLPFADHSMDFVFSSHCIEHSTDLKATFGELKRVLRQDGLLYFSVPFGFDSSDEHLLFLGIEEWLRICEVAGFKVKLWTVGNTYSEAWDLSILAQSQTGEFDGDRVSALDKAYQKVGHTYVEHDDPCFDYEDAVTQAPFTICRKFAMTEKARYLLLLRHGWCGVLNLTDAKGRRKQIDLFERADHIYALPIGEMTAPIHGEITGRNPASKSDQLVVYGALR